MTIQNFERLADIPGIDRYLDILPVFATQEYSNYLQKTTSHSTSWFCSIVKSDLRFMIPFAVKNKFFSTKGQFLTATIYLDGDANIETEREFLNEIVQIIKQEKLCDWIEQPPNWALFNVVPSNSIYCEFGTFKIDLENKDENGLYNKLDRSAKYEIRKAIKNNVVITKGYEKLDDCVKIFTETAERSTTEFPDKDNIKKLLDYFPQNIEIFISYYNDIPQSSNIVIYDKLCTYGLHSGTTKKPLFGSNYLLFWHLIKEMKKSGLKNFDLVGARINPLAGSKQEKIQIFKKHIGGELVKGFLWKMPINKFKYKFYKVLVRTYLYLWGKKYVGDIIDQEIKRNYR
jgi:hypothetical protein